MRVPNQINSQFTNVLHFALAPPVGESTQPEWGCCVTAPAQVEVEMCDTPQFCPIYLARWLLTLCLLPGVGAQLRFSPFFWVRLCLELSRFTRPTNDLSLTNFLLLRTSPEKMDVKIVPQIQCNTRNEHMRGQLLRNDLHNFWKTQEWTAAFTQKQLDLRFP
jgi:hypothetical protein